MKLVFPFLALQVKLFQTATEIAVSSVAAATSLAADSLNATARAASQTADACGSVPSSPMSFPAGFASGSGLPMFTPVANLASQTAELMVPPRQAPSWSFAAPSWPAPRWPIANNTPFAFFPNPFERRRTAVEQMADPFDLWTSTAPSLTDFVPSLPLSFDGLRHIMPSAPGLKTVQAIILAWSGPLLAQSPGTFPRPFFGL